MDEIRDKALEMVRTEIAKADGQGILAKFVRAQNFAVKLAELSIRLMDTDPCEYDHHSYCQAHSLHEKPCPHEVIKQLLKS